MKATTRVPLTPELLKNDLERMIAECQKGIDHPQEDTPPAPCLLGAIWCMQALLEGYFGPAENHNNN